MLHHLLAHGHWSGPALLLCPATSTMASYAALGPAPPLNPNVTANVVVVGAEGDELCNTADMNNFRSWGAATCTVNDDHMIMHENSAQVVIEQLRRLVSKSEDRKRD